MIVKVIKANEAFQELYEPLFDDLCYSLWHSYGVEIKYILSTDVVNQGKSYALNEQKLGNDGMASKFYVFPSYQF